MLSRVGDGRRDGRRSDARRIILNWFRRDQFACSVHDEKHNETQQKFLNIVVLPVNHPKTEFMEEGDQPVLLAVTTCASTNRLVDSLERGCLAVTCLILAPSGLVAVQQPQAGVASPHHGFDGVVDRASPVAGYDMVLFVWLVLRH